VLDDELLVSVMLARVLEMTPASLAASPASAAQAALTAPKAKVIRTGVRKRILIEAFFTSRWLERHPSEGTTSAVLLRGRRW